MCVYMKRAIIALHQSHKDIHETRLDITSLALKSVVTCEGDKTVAQFCEFLTLISSNCVMVSCPSPYVVLRVTMLIIP
jgi:hypothetical protein